MSLPYSARHCREHWHVMSDDVDIIVDAGDKLDAGTAHSEAARLNIEWLQAEVARLTRERDLAIAHDTQPYPTAEAYDLACKALARTKADRETMAKEWGQLRETYDRLVVELVEARKELEAERTVRQTCARVADQLQTALDAHRRFHGKVGCPGLIDGCYVCQAEQSIDPTTTEPAT